MKINKRLEELFDQKDVQISMLEEKLERYENSERDAWAWTKHKKLSAKQQLPVPRLECRAKPIHGDDWNNFVWEYCLVYKHLLGDIIAVPIGQTKIQCSSGRKPVRTDGRIDGPFRDGAHIQHEAESLNLPAYFVVEDSYGETCQKIEIKSK